MPVSRVSRRSPPSSRSAGDTASSPLPASAPAGPVDNAVRRLSVPLRDDGSIAVETLRSSTRESLRRAVADARLSRELGLTGESSQIQLPPAVGAALVGTLATLDILLVEKITGAPRAVVIEVGALSDAERAALVPSLLAVCNKYGSTFLSKYGDEVALLTLLASMTADKVTLVRDRMARQTGPSRVVPMAQPTEPNADPDSADTE